MAMTGIAMTIPRTIGQTLTAPLLTCGRLLLFYLCTESKRTGKHAAEESQIANDVIEQGVSCPLTAEIGEREYAHQEKRHGD